MGLKRPYVCCTIHTLWFLVGDVDVAPAIDKHVFALDDKVAGWQRPIATGWIGRQKPCDLMGQQGVADVEYAKARVDLK